MVAHRVNAKALLNFLYCLQGDYTGIERLKYDRANHYSAIVLTEFNGDTCQEGRHYVMEDFF